MIHGHIDGMIETKDQIVEGLISAADQGSDHAVWVRGHCGAFDRLDRSDVDGAAGLDELLDVQRRARENWLALKAKDPNLSLSIEEKNAISGLHAIGQMARFGHRLK
jgi:hypothetical protein